MLAKGYSFKELLGKDNPQTAELRFIEHLVGPIQSVSSGHIPKRDFQEYISHLDLKITEDILTSCLTEIKLIIVNWQQLQIGQKLTLKWNLSKNN